MKTDLFQSCGHCWIFQICWHIKCSTFTASSFMIWNRSAGNPSPPLALFALMLPKAHLTSHFRMSGSRWVITPSWLSEHEDLFCTVLLCILATSYYLLLLLGPYCFSLLLSLSLHEMFPWNLVHWFLNCRCSLLPSPVWPLPIYLDSWTLHSRFLCDIVLYSIGLTSITNHIHHWALFSLWLHLFILSGVISPLFSSSILGTYWSGKFIFQSHIFCLSILFMEFSRQEYWSGLPFLSPVDHVLSELSTMTCSSWVVLHSMPHRFTEFV